MYARTIGTRHSLTWPPELLWSFEDGFADDVEPIIATGMLDLSRGSRQPLAFHLAYERVVPVLKRSLSIRQRLRAYFVVGAALIALDVTTLGVTYLDVAIDLAQELLDPAAAAQIAHIAGAAERAWGSPLRALRYQSYSLDLLRAARAEELPHDVALELDVLPAVAFCRFVLDQYEAAADDLASASHLLLLVPQQEQTAAQIDWIGALIARWRGEHERALKLALTAVERYKRLLDGQLPAAQASLGRLSTVVADITLDMATLSPERVPQVDRETLAGVGDSFAQQALHLAHSTGDRSGIQTAQLARARYKIATGQAAAGRHLVEQVVAWAQREQEMATLSQAQSVLGGALDASGEHGQALSVYAAAWETARRNDMPAMGTFARRVLLLESEMRS